LVAPRPVARAAVSLHDALPICAAGEIGEVTRIPATTILPPGTNGRQHYDVLGTGGTRSDPKKARELLEEAGKIGFEIRFAYRARSEEHTSELQSRFDLV